MTAPAILSLATAVPPYRLRQADVARTLQILAAAAGLADDDQTAKRTAERMLASYPDFRIRDFGNWPFKDPESAERLVEGLRLAGLPE